MASKLRFNNLVAAGSISAQTLVAGRYPTQTLSASISDDGTIPVGAGILRTEVIVDAAAEASGSSAGTPSQHRGYCGGTTFGLESLPFAINDGSTFNSATTFGDLDPVTGVKWTRTSVFSHSYGITIPSADNAAVGGWNGTDPSYPVDWSVFILDIYYFYIAHLDVVSGSGAGGTTVVLGINGFVDSGSSFTTVSSVTFGGVAASIVSVAAGKTYEADVTVVTPAGSGIVDVVATLDTAHGQFATKVGAYTYTGGNAPTNLTATAASTNPPQVDLAWTDNSTGESGFEVYRADEPTPTSFAFTGIAFTNSYSDTTVGTSTRYYYKVRAIGGGVGFPTGYSNTANVALGSAQVPSTYVNGVASALDTFSDSFPVTTAYGSPATGYPAVGCAVGGTAVTLHGYGFNGSPTVTFGGTGATSVVVVSSTQITCVAPAHAAGTVDIVITNGDATVVTSKSGFRYGTPYWTRTLTLIVDGTTYTFATTVQSCTPPTSGIWVLQGIDAPVFAWWRLPSIFGFPDLDWYVYQEDSPGTGWVAGVPSSIGWYYSTAAFGGSIVVVSSGTPADGRTWADISVWAASGAAMLGGSPSASCIFQNRMIYPATGYTVGTDYPPIRVFDGSFDHELARLPPTTSNTVPKAVMSMLSANGTIYLTTFDSGTNSTTWSGRVFELSLDSGALTPIGAPFTGGEMPYALAWHMGRLWVGTNNGIGTVGKVYYFRPGIDSSWTSDYDLATSSVGGVDSMVSYKGQLFVGSDNQNAAFAKLLVRDSSGAYTTSLTATGGTAKVNNGFLAMKEFGGNLYASYWNNDTTKIAKIYKYDNSSWTTAYNGATTTLRPFILLQVDNNVLFGFGGGLLLAGAVISTPDGTTWTNLTAQLPEADKTITPLFGVEIL